MYFDRCKPILVLDSGISALLKKCEITKEAEQYGMVLSV